MSSHEDDIVRSQHFLVRINHHIHGVPFNANQAEFQCLVIELGLVLIWNLDEAFGSKDSKVTDSGCVLKHLFIQSDMVG